MWSPNATRRGAAALRPYGTGLLEPAPSAHDRLHFHLQVPAPRLLRLERFEQRLEVAFAKAAAAVALDDLDERRRAILDRAREDLQQVALVVAVDENPQLAQGLEGLVDGADPPGGDVVVGVGDAQEFHPA